MQGMKSLMRDLVFERSLGAALADRDNNLLLLRWIAASMVLFGHSWALVSTAAAPDPDPVSEFLRSFSGSFAVSMFFFISGLLISKSWSEQPYLPRFLLARACRIYPALMICVALTTVLLGASQTSFGVGEYLGNGDTWRYLVKNASAWTPEFHLPGVFGTHRTPAVNGSLWTLPVEVRMYLAIGLLGALGWLVSRWHFVIGAALLLGLSLAVYPHINVLASIDAGHLVSCFAAGAFAFFFRRWIPVSGLFMALLLGAFCLLRDTLVPWRDANAAALACGLVLWIGFSRFAPRWRSGQDWSYGIYLYAYPLQQVCVALWPPIGPYTLSLIAFAMTLICAGLSWNFIERPALQWFRRRRWRINPNTGANSQTRP
jgi:peptidoglycan/LPS O-acetylase OafA/YrhL